MCNFAAKFKFIKEMLLKFFLTCNKIGAFTLGGGYAMIPKIGRAHV